MQGSGEKAFSRGEKRSSSSISNPRGCQLLDVMCDLSNMQVVTSKENSLSEARLVCTASVGEPGTREEIGDPSAITLTACGVPREPEGTLAR